MKKVVTFMLLALAGCAHDPCDLNDDGKPAQEVDFKVLQWSMGSKKGDYNFVKDADFDHSGSITSADFGIYMKQCGEE